MKLIPAIDLKDNKCVRLSKGKEETSTIYNDNPVEQARFFEKEGCDRIHIVDLDAAFGRNETNKKTILKIREKISASIELGGGIRSEEDVAFWIKNKINYLILGSLAAKDSEYMKKIADHYPDRLYLALDDLNGKFMIHGWTQESQYNTKDMFACFNTSNIRGFVYTDISRDGMLRGIDIKKITRYLYISKKSIIVGGGLSNYGDLKNLVNLKNLNLEGVIVGKSFYSEKINIKKSLKILNQNA